MWDRSLRNPRSSTSPEADPGTWGVARFGQQPEYLRRHAQRGWSRPDAGRGNAHHQRQGLRQQGRATTSAPMAVAIVSPRSVRITSPAGGSTWAMGTNEAITASATGTAGSGGALSRVDFYAGGGLVGTSSSAPYTATWKSFAAPASITLAATTSAATTPLSRSPITASTGLPRRGRRSPLAKVWPTKAAADDVYTAVQSSEGAASTLVYCKIDQ